MKKQILTKIIATIVLATTLLLGNVGATKAALQANSNTQYTKADNPENWMKNFREMEKAGGAMGLDETLNGNLTAKESNDIDVHMMRATEYGAIAILSASGYGNPNKINGTNVTTTGNKTGMILSTNAREYVAGGYQGKIFAGTDARYYDTYTDANSARVGDALGASTATNPGCQGWYGATAVWVNETYHYFSRGEYGIFSFNNNLVLLSIGTFCGRGVAVCGEGL